MRAIFAVCCQSAALLTAFHRSHSLGGFLITGIGPVVLVDRYIGRLVLKSPISWRKELCARGGTFLAGAGVCYFIRPGVVPLWEAGHAGLIVCLVVVLLESIMSWAMRFRGRWDKLRLTAALAVSFGVLIPVLVALHPVHTVPKRTPAAFGLPFQDIRFDTADGLPLAGWLIPHPQARGNVVFCHGHGRNRGHVAGLLQTFHELGLNVLAFDFRGHGDSPGHTSTFGEHEVEDLVAAEAYLKRRFPDRPVMLVGVSLGAAVALQALPRMPHVRGVWSEGAFARLGSAAHHKLSLLPRPLRAPLVNLYYLFGWLDCGLWGPAVNPIDHVKGLNVPIFFCHGMEDELIPLSDGQALYNSYGGPKCHWWVHGASHYNVRQRNREEYLSRLRVFLEKCLDKQRIFHGQRPGTGIPRLHRGIQTTAHCQPSRRR